MWTSSSDSEYSSWNICWFSLSLQLSQECVLAGAGAPGCVLNFASRTATAPTMRNAATMDADTSALHHTQVRFTQIRERDTPVVFRPITSICWHFAREYLNTVTECVFVSWPASEAGPLRSAPGDPHVCRVLLSRRPVSRRGEVLQDDLRPRLQRALLRGQPITPPFS